jgi:hypothetical protein
MGHSQSKQSAKRDKSVNNLIESDIELILNNTSFDRDQILDWHAGFIGLILKKSFFK